MAATTMVRGSPEEEAAVEDEPTMLRWSELPSDDVVPPPNEFFSDGGGPPAEREWASRRGPPPADEDSDCEIPPEELVLRSKVFMKSEGISLN